MPDVQRRILDEHSPMTAKMRGKPFRKQSRPDWDAVRVKIMRWCLRVKLVQNWLTFGDLLLTTGDYPIVEQSRKDEFWGAKVADGTLVGMNVLGRLLMELREQLKTENSESLRVVEPLPIPEFLLLQRPIETVCAGEEFSHPVAVDDRRTPANIPPAHLQPSLFDQPTIARGQADIHNNLAIEVSRKPVLTPYSGYRDSGLPWLGRMPEHWDIRRNGRLFAQRNDTGHGNLPVLEVSLRTGVRVRDLDNGARKQMMTDRSKYKRAGKGDIAYNMMRMWQGAVGVAPVDGLISPSYVVAAPFPEVEPRYYSYLFRTVAYMREVDTFSRGIVSDRNRLYWDAFKQMPSAFPSTEEQRIIANFLDAHGRLTARLIRNKRRLIALLNTQKQAIINQVVTRGLDPQAPMKPTGIEWMPEVPAHWEAKRLKYLTKFLNGIAFKPSDWKDSGVPIIRIENLNGGDTFNYTDRDDLPETRLIQPGDLVFAWSGNRGTSFGSFEWTREFPAYLNQHIFKLEGYDLHRKYFFYLLRAVTKHVEDNAHGIIGLVHVTKPVLGGIFVPLAPQDEQREIADRIDEGLAELNRVTDKVVSEIRLIGEYRERLISDVVTGKLDVRHIEISAPAEQPAIDDAEDLEEEIATDDADVVEEVDGGV
jgi:type I restriction enzyme S subunit